MEKSGVISVIVPVYRVEKYLEECVESILNQTYKDLEVILVDDGSPDGCGGICDRYAQADSRVVAVHQKNAGAAAARNAGLRVATGEYIAFVDGDDSLEPDAYEKMLDALVCYEADMVQSNFQSVYLNGKEVYQGYERVCCFSTTEYLCRFLQDWTCALCWDKLFKRHVLQDVYFEEGHLIDDEYFTYQGAMKAGKIVGIPAVTYNYRQRASGVMQNPLTLERKNLDTLNFLKKRMDQVVSAFPELKETYEGYYADRLLWIAESYLATQNTIREIKKSLLEFVAGGKVLFWKAGQRKRTLRILSLLMKPAAKIQIKWEERTEESGYAFFE